MPIIRDLGEKLDFLEGIIGFAFPARRFENQELAARLSVRPEQMSRKRSGDAPISHRELSALVELFQLGPVLDFQLFLQPDVGAFEALLRRVRVGTYGLDGGALVRQQLLNDDRCKKSGVALTRLATKMRGGGLGLNEGTPKDLVRLWVGDQATIRVEIPGDGHLVVLSDNLMGEVIALMPSCFGPQSRVTGKSAKLPNPDGVYAALDVSPPAGWYRIFSIWSALPISLPRLEATAEDQPPLPLLAEDLRAIGSAISELKRENHPYEIRTADYFVAE